MDRTKEYSFVLSTMPRLHARSRLLEQGVYTTTTPTSSFSAKWHRLLLEMVTAVYEREIGGGRVGKGGRGAGGRSEVGVNDSF